MNTKESQVLEPMPLSDRHVIVCVDDDAAILASLRRLLRGEPYDLVTVSSPREALERLGRGGVSLVITDQRMPGMVGTDFLEEVRRRAPDTIRVMLTGYPGSSSVSYGLADGIEWLISKPWNDEALKLTIRQLLHDRESGRRPRRTDTGRMVRDTATRPAIAPAALTRAQRSAQDLRREIEDRLGFFPTFFAPAAEAPEVLEHLWGHTVAAYLENPLPPLAKEKLSAYLGRFCKVPYCLICHSCALHELGLPASEILVLLEEPPPPMEMDMAAQLTSLAPDPLAEWPEPGTPLEKVLLRASVALFLKGANAERCRTELRRLLGESTYARLLELLSYIRTCHAWVEGHPEVSHEADARVEQRLPVLLLEAPGLKEFFEDHVGYVRRERKWVEDKLLDIVRALRRRETEFRRAQDELELRVQERTSELSRVNAALVKEIIGHRQAEEELREMNVILENAVEGISRLDTRGCYLSLNKACADILGCTPEELLGRDWTTTVHPDDRACLEAACEEMRVSGKAELEDRGLRKDGAVVHRHIVMIRADDKEGNFTGHYCFTKDITERKRAEEERDRLNAQLLQGQKLAAIGQLAAGVAHEINNPVGYILSNLTTMGEYCGDLLLVLRTAREVADRHAAGENVAPGLERLARLRKKIDADFILEDFQKAAEESRQGAEKIRDIVKSLREFSHVDEGALKPGDLNKCLEDTLRICWNELKYKATVHREYGQLPPVPCYPQRIEQVFINLLMNAAQAMEKKGDITVVTCLEDGYAVVRIRDTGCGIPKENMKRLFEPFFTTKPVGKGTGLGLHVAYKIVRAHDGRIEVSSEPGRGTEVAVRLPLSGPRRPRA